MSPNRLQFNATKTDILWYLRQLFDSLSCLVLPFPAYRDYVTPSEVVRDSEIMSEVTCQHAFPGCKNSRWRRQDLVRRGHEIKRKYFKGDTKNVT